MLESSPRTQASGNRRSSTSRTLRRSCATLRIVCEGPCSSNYTLLFAARFNKSVAVLARLVSVNRRRLIHTAGGVPLAGDTVRRGAPFFCVRCCSAYGKPCLFFDRNRLLGGCNRLARLCSAFIHKLIH